MDDTCVVPKRQRYHGWMFFGCFSVYHGKGPAVFWEKDWGTITSESYRQHIVPIIDGWVRLQLQVLPERPLRFMQDGASGHRARATIEDLRDRHIDLIEWPSLSPDLNPIERVWDKMKDWIQVHYPNAARFNYDQLRRVILEAWEAVPFEEMVSFVDDLYDRMQAIIEAQGGHIDG